MTNTEPHNEDESEGRPDKLAKSSLFVGIVAILASILVTVGGFALGVAAIVVGAAGLVNVRRGVATGTGTAVGGVVTGAVGCAPFVLHLLGI